VLGVGDEDDFATPGSDVGCLAEQAFVIEHGLALEDAVPGATVDQHALAQAVQLDVHDLRNEPAFRDGRERLLQAAQLIVFLCQSLVAHGPQLQLAVPGD
jgi:hypothetical protein